MGERSMSHPDDWQREATAYHEAGHAVVRYLLAFEPKSVTISSTRNAQNAAKYGDPLRGIRLDTDGSGRAGMRLEKAIRISYAGPLAEKKYSVHWRVTNGAYDFGRIEELGLIACDNSRNQAKLFLHWLEVATQEMVDTHWAAIERVAKRLLVHDRLAGAHISAVMRGAYSAESSNSEHRPRRFTLPKA
jgi:hypothetical protein